ncbi:MAG TPA: pitrilysin family protein [bacterium]
MPARMMLVFLLLALLAHPAPAAPTTRPVTREILANGLTVVVAESHATDVVTLNAWVKVGSRDETDELNGAAHFVEHLLFKGTRRRQVGEISREVESVGGQLNASTSFDYTQYYIVAASRFFDRILDIQADALMNSTVDPVEVDRERTVVLQELALIDDSPGRSAFTRLYSLLYPGHPYRRPVGGLPEIIRRLTRDQLFEFYRAHYGPSNVTLVIAGDVNTAETMARVRSVLGPWRHLVQGRAAAVAVPPPSEVRRAAVAQDVRVATILLGWIGADVRNPDHYALDVLVYVLGQGRGARLIRSLRDRQQLVQSVGASFGTSLDPGLFAISAVADPQQAGRVEQAILAELSVLRDQGVSADELNRAKTLIEMETLVDQQTSRGWASNLGFAATIAGLDYHETYLGRIRAVTAADVQRAAGRYLDPQRYALVLVQPRSP